MIRNPTNMPVETRANMRGGAGVVTIQHYFSPAEFQAGVRLCAKLTLPPGASIGTHQHEREDEVYLILSGTGILSDGTTESRVTAGDAILTGKGGSHAVRNDGAEALEIAAFIATYPA
jgi:mannose-6-phosphate isomerase-like protein (cupin superfamily)